MNLKRLWSWLTEGPAIKPDPPRGYPPVIVLPEESAESAAMPEVPYSVRVDEPTEEQKAVRAAPTVTLAVPPGLIVDEPGPVTPPPAPKPPLKPRKRRTRRHK